jgi:hypothetical protein
MARTRLWRKAIVTSQNGLRILALRPFGSGGTVLVGSQIGPHKLDR